MKKAERIAALVGQTEIQADPSEDAHYLGYFQCFNAGQYYEAHDVLEQLWLKTEGGNHLFFKGLIQLAGAFVHLQKQFRRPMHPKDGRRLHPAARLFRLAANNLQSYQPLHLHCDVESVTRLCLGLADKIEKSNFKQNPWDPENPPRISLVK
jgi:hypothetical protein